MFYRRSIKSPHSVLPVAHTNAVAMVSEYAHYWKAFRPPQPAVSRDVETIAFHATPVLPDKILAILLRVRGVGEEHALVTGRLLIFADAAWLLFPQ